MRLNSNQGTRSQILDAADAAAGRPARPTQQLSSTVPGGYPRSEDDLFRDPFSDFTPSGR